MEHSENVPKLSMYLGAKSVIDWQDIDYYNHYIKTGSFGFSMLHSFNSKTQKQKEIVGKTIEYQEFIGTLNTYKIRYDYIFNKLDKDAKKEFKFDFCDQLENLKSKQTETKFKEAINDLIKSVNGASQQNDNNNTDEVKQKKEFELKENNFDKVQPDKVINHFKQLVDNGYITQLNFEIFIETVFEKNQIVTSKIEIIKQNSKSRVRKIFYNYYETYSTQKYGAQKKYIELLSDNFTGFDYTSLTTNFSK
ncbi:MAG: hypothetical protein RQ864_10830 [Lutibacter sp.]|nr:hypothetical protein [Lutibacter sp.]